MVNKERGEVALKISGKTYTLCLDMDGLAKLDNEFDTTLADIGEVLEKASSTQIREIL